LAAEWRKNETAFLRAVIDSQLAAALFLSPRSHIQRGDNKRSKHIYLTVRAFLLGLLCLYLRIATGTSVYLFWANTIARSWSLGENDAKFMWMVYLFYLPLSHM
jgi:hypothetical protein